MSNLKRVVAVVAVFGLVSSGIAVADPLASGKPAGVKKAQVEGWPPLVWVGLAAVVGAGIAAAATSGSSPSSFTTVAPTTGTAG